MNLSNDARGGGRLAEAGRIAFCAAAVAWFWLSREFFCYDLTIFPALCVVAFGVGFWGVFGAGLGAGRVRRRAAVLFLVTNLAFLFLGRFPLTPRQQFFQDVDDVHPGMTLIEAETRLAKYRPVMPYRFNGRTGPSARPVETQFSGSLNYVRADENGDFSAYKDFAIVTFEDSRVVGVMPVGD